MGIKGEKEEKAIDKVYEGIRIVTVLGLIMLVLYGALWVFKKVSFYLFYEDMVREIISEMVKVGALR
tara:strand:+ start:403 stop:603 length:201 start_codon:yes stop_codon:yes gene_type:complete